LRGFVSLGEKSAIASLGVFAEQYLGQSRRSRPPTHASWAREDHRMGHPVSSHVRPQPTNRRSLAYDFV